MLRISDFSELTGVTVKALRHYDRVGLLKPARVDDENGYCYYSVDQLPRLNHIVAFKELGFTLEHIAKLLTEEVTTERLEGLLGEKKYILEAEMAQKQARLARIATRLGEIREFPREPYTVRLRHIEPQRVASVRDKATAHTIGSLFREVFAHLERLNVEAAGPIRVVQYEMFPDRSFGIDACVPLAREVPRPKDGRVRVWTQPALEHAACTVHRGDYRDVGHAYRALLGWLEANRHQKAGPICAVYLEMGNRTMTHGPEVTELQLPVQKL